MTEVTVTVTDTDVDVLTTDDEVTLSVTETPDVLVSTAVFGPQGPPGTPGSAGSQGPQGPPGIPGDGSAAYTHDQNTPAALWTVTHNLGYYPNVSVTDSGGTQVEGSVVYINTNSLTVEFTNPFGGKAYLS